ncbi:MAG: ribosome biogenesis GTPase Der [Phycisphaerales bacterium]
MALPMGYFRIAIVGRPNVGKSSILNMLAARKVSIVDDTPGTTRDRVATLVKLEGEDPARAAITVEITDTGGFGVYTAAGRQIDDAGADLSVLTDDIEYQIGQAVRDADLVLFVVDAQAGITAQDREVARLLREGGLGPKSARLAKKDSAEKSRASAPAQEKVLMVSNKCDGPRWESDALEAASLGFGDPLVVSAKNNFRRRELVERLHEIVRKALGRKKSGPDGELAAMLLAIVGKRNAGKSSLVNALAGEQRVIVSEIAGTTRDAVDVRFEIEGRAFVAIDTAGLRRKKSFKERIEHWALDRCEQAIQRSDVTLLMIDATTPISKVDQQLGMMIAEAYKPVVIVVNKWDLAVGKQVAKGSGAEGAGKRRVTTDDYEVYIRKELRGLNFAPIAFMSAKKGSNIKETIGLAFDLFEQAHARATTGKLNRLVREIVEHQGPSNKLGTFAKIMYVAQITTAPPTIVCVVNKPKLFTPNYLRFLMNRFREELPFPEVPIKLLIRDRKRDEAMGLADGTLARAADPEKGQRIDVEEDAAVYFED